MLKIRLIPVLYIKNGFIVRSENFTEHKIIGNVVNEVRRYNQWDIDELVYIDISRDKTYDSRRDDHKIGRVRSIDDILNLVSKECFMPLSFGGGVRDLETIKKYLSNGADKVIVNTMLHKNPNEVKKAISIYGSQAIIASLDYRIIDGGMKLFIENGTVPLPYSLYEVIDIVEDIGCGEILFTSMDADGKGEGYDFESINTLVENCNLPVVACGGALSISDFNKMVKVKGISGVAAGNMFHFTENIYPRSKKKLKETGLNFR